MKYTKKQRNEIYKKALSGYVEDDCNRMLGLCMAIRRVTGNDLHYFIDYRVKLFPEFNLFFGDTCWFDLGHNSQGFKTRQIILDFCILMTEE